ncbi:MAG: uroporphyrinogen-III C-methyltransferase [Pseudomonadota bacterium]
MRLDYPFLPEFERASVWLVGAGPGDPGLLSLLGLYALQQCDCLVYDALVNPHLLELANPRAKLIFAGKRGGRPSSRQDDICKKLIEEASSNKRCLRLKGGDPVIFGRAGEEIRALVKAGIRFRVVPGITAAGALIYAGIPLTDRRFNATFSVATGHGVNGDLPDNINWQALSDSATVLIFYMALKHLERIVKKLIESGRDENESAGLIEHLSMPTQQTRTGRLKDLNVMKNTLKGGPAIVVIGPVVDLRDVMGWFDPPNV